MNSVVGPDESQNRRKLVSMTHCFKSFITRPLYQKPNISGLHTKFIQLHCGSLCLINSFMFKTVCFLVSRCQWSTGTHREAASCLWHGYLSACIYVLLSCVDRNLAIGCAPVCGYIPNFEYAYCYRCYTSVSEHDKGLFSDGGVKKKCLEMTVFWDVTPCSLVEIYRRFRGTYCLHHQGE
jgi:hypothetical protein